MACVRPNVVGARKRKALIFYMINQLLYEKRSLCVLSPFLGLRTTYTVHLTLIGKPVVDFLLVIIELFPLDVTAEELRANIDGKSPFLKEVGHSDPKFQVEGDVPHEPFVRR